MLPATLHAPPFPSSARLYSDQIGVSSDPDESPGSSKHPTTSLPPLKRLLEELGIIDNNGELVNPENLPPFPSLDLIDKTLLETVLNQPVTIGIDTASETFTLRELLTYVDTQYTQYIANVEIIGGFIRKLLLESPRFLLAVLKALTHLEPDDLQPYVEEIVEASQKRPLPDIDFRVHCSLNDENILRILRGSIARFFSAKLKRPINEIKAHIFTKYYVVYNKENQYSITTFKPKETFEYELLFVGAGGLKRQHLFVHDSLRVPIRPFLQNKNTYCLETDCENLWRPIIRLLTKVIHIPDPEGVDLFGFSTLMSYFTRGWSAASVKDINILAKQVRQAGQKERGLAPLAADLLAKTLRNHHPEDPYAAIALTINACLHLNASTKECAAIWKLMRKGRWDEEKLKGVPLLYAIDQAIFVEAIPFNEAAAAVALYQYAFMEGQKTEGLPISGCDNFLQIPIKPGEAADILSASENIPALTSILLHAPMKGAAIDHDGLLEKGIGWISSDLLSQCFLGMVILLILKHKRGLPYLLEHFIDLLNFVPESGREHLIESMKQIPDGAPLVSEFEKKYAIPSSDPLIDWIATLASTPKTSPIAKRLWKRCRQEYSQAEKEKIDTVVIAGLIPHAIEDALELLKEKSRTAEAEAALLARILTSVNGFEESRFATLTPRLLKQIDKTFTVFQNQKQPLKNPKRLTRPLAAFIKRLITQNSNCDARALLEQAAAHPLIAPNDPHLYGCWMEFLKDPNPSSNDRLNEWDQIHEVFGEPPEEWRNNSIEVFCAIIQALLGKEKSREEGYKRLRTLAEKTEEKQPSIAQLAEQDIQLLIDDEHFDTAAQLIDQVYANHLDPATLAFLNKDLFNIFLKKGELEKAYQRWKKLNGKYTETAQTLLDALTANSQNLKNLRVALRMLWKETGDILTPDEKFEYFQSIHQTNHFPNLLGRLVDAYIKVPSALSHAGKLDIVKCALKAFEEDKDLDEALVDKIQQAASSILKILQAEKNPEDIETFLQLSGKWTAPLKDASHCQSLANLYLGNHNHEKALAWIKKASASGELPEEWLSKILREYQLMEPEQEADMLIACADQIKALPILLSSTNNRIATLLSKEKIAVDTSLLLLERFPPESSLLWRNLITQCPNSAYHQVWDCFYAWLATLPTVDKELRKTVTLAFCRFVHLEDPPQKILFAAFDDPESSLGRLSSSPEEKMEMQAKLLFSYADHVDKPEDLQTFYHPLKKEANSTDILDLRLIFFHATLNLIKIFIKKECASFPIFSCNLLSELAPFIPEALENISKDDLVQTFLDLLQAMNEGEGLEGGEEALNLLIAFSSHLRTNDLSEAAFLKIAEAFSAFNTAPPLEECGELLKLAQDTPSAKKIWGVYLPKWLKKGFDWSDFNALQSAFDYHAAHIDRIEKGSPECLECADIVFDIIIKHLDEKSTLPKFSELLTACLQSRFGDKHISVFTSIGATKPNPTISPVIEIKLNQNQSNRALFFDQMTTLLSKIFDRTPINTPQDSENLALHYYVHNFLTKNLALLCLNFLEKSAVLVPLLDRYFFHYPPENTRFFTVHLNLAKGLLFKAIADGLYKNHRKELDEAVLFITMRPHIDVSDNNLNAHFLKNQLNKCVENVIERILSFNSPHAVIRAMLILQTNRKTIAFEREFIEKIYLKILDALMINPLFMWENKPLILSVGTEMLADSMLAGFASNGGGEKREVRIISDFFNKCFSLFQFSNHSNLMNNRDLRVQLLNAIAKFLHLCRQIGAFWKGTGGNQYFTLAEKIVKIGILEYPHMNKEQKGCISRSFNKMIIAKEDFNRLPANLSAFVKPLLPKALTQETLERRSKLMRKWTEFIVSQEKSVKNH